MTLTLTLILVPSLALLLTAGLTPLVRGAALQTGTVAEVRADRWHKRATPAVGGIAIFLGFGISVLLGAIMTPEIGSSLDTARDSLVPLSHWQAILVAGTLLFGVGVVDDLVHLEPFAKLAAQIVGAGVLILSGVGVWLTGVYAVDVVLSLFWFVAVTNAMNLLDNMDGLSAGTGAIAGGILAVLLLLDGDMGAATIALALSGSLLGFLAHNYPPARIFMGDSGSLFLGIVLAGLALSPAPGLSRGLFAVLAIPALILAVPILDTTFVTVGRLLEGRPVSQGGRDHTSHGLVSLGATEERAVWILWGLALLGGGVGLLFRTTDRALAGALGGVLLAALALLGAYLLSARNGHGSSGGSGVSRERSDDHSDGPREETLYERMASLHGRMPVLQVGLDILLIGLAYFTAYLIRWEPSELGPQLEYFRSTVALVLVLKAVAFLLSGAYQSRWHHFGLEDGVRVLRSNVLATVVAAAGLLLFQRVGLSRGVLIIDFFVCSVLTLGARFSFRLIEGTTRRFSDQGTAVIVVGAPADVEMAVRELRRSEGPSIRPVAVADVRHPARGGSVRGYPAFGGAHALRNAVEGTGTHSVLVVRRLPEEEWRLPEEVRDHLQTVGALDVYVLSVELERWSDGPAP